MSKRIFMLADLHNFYGKLTALPDAIKEAQEYQCAFPEVAGQPFSHYMAERIAENYAEKVADDWDYPSEYDLVIWEITDQEDESPTAPMIRVKVNVRTVPVYRVEDTEEVHVGEVRL